MNSFSYPFDWPLEGNWALFRKNHMENPTHKSGSQSGGDVQGEPPPRPLYSPFKIQIVVEDFPYECSEQVPGCLLVTSLQDHLLAWLGQFWEVSGTYLGFLGGFLLFGEIVWEIAGKMFREKYETSNKKL